MAESEYSPDSASRGSAIGGGAEAATEERVVDWGLGCDVDAGFSADRIGLKDGVGRPEAFASSMAASCVSMR